MERNQQGDKKLILIGVGILAAILAILGIIAVARRTTIPQPANTIHTQVTTPTLIPERPKDLDAKIKSLEDQSKVIDLDLATVK